MLLKKINNSLKQSLVDTTAVNSTRKRLALELKKIIKTIKAKGFVICYFLHKKSSLFGACYLKSIQQQALRS